MKEDQEQGGGALVPSASSALTSKSRGLVRRGLDDLLKVQSSVTSREANANERNPSELQQMAGSSPLDKLDEVDRAFLIEEYGSLEEVHSRMINKEKIFLPWKERWEK